MFKSILPLILAAGLATPALAFDLENMSPAERAAFGEAVRAYLMENPQVILDAVDQLEDQKRAQQAEADKTLVQVNAEDLLNDGYSWVGGNPQGDITMVEFLDYRCGYCRRAHPEVEELIASDGNIRLIVKEFPILGEDSEASSRFAIAVKQIAGDAAYKRAHDALISMRSSANESSLRKIAGLIEVDADAVLARMGDDSVTAVIADTRALAQRLQINGTPSFVLGDEMLRGYLPLDAMRQIVAAERADG